MLPPVVAPKRALLHTMPQWSVLIQVTNAEFRERSMLGDPATGCATYTDIKRGSRTRSTCRWYCWRRALYTRPLLTWGSSADWRGLHWSRDWNDSFSRPLPLCVCPCGWWFSRVRLRPLTQEAVIRRITWWRRWWDAAKLGRQRNRSPGLVLALPRLHECGSSRR